MNSGHSIIIHYVLEMVEIVFLLCKFEENIHLSSCMTWIMIQSKTKHLLCLGNFIFHFILLDSNYPNCFTIDEIANFMLLFLH
jgi:hypothetical protein